MKIADLTIENLKKYIQIKGLSEKGNKTELCERILEYVEEQVIKEIQQYWNSTTETRELQEDPMDESDELGTQVQNFVTSHENEKIKILKSYDDLQNQKQKLKERREQQKQNLINIPSIVRFSVGPKVSISKSLLEKHPNSMLYTLISSPIWFEKYQENENQYYLNCSENEMLKIVDSLRNDTILDPGLAAKWGFSLIEYSNTAPLQSENKLLENKEDYQKFKEIIEKEIEYQSNLLVTNFKNYEKQLESLTDLIYNDPILLNVGGKDFSISKTKLEQHENTYFGPIVSGQWELENNTHFIDRSYHHFHILHDYLVHGELNYNLHQYFNSLNGTDQNTFLKDLDYYQLCKVVDHLNYGFKESKILNKEELEYVQKRFPGSWKLISSKDVTNTINETTIIIKHVTKNVKPTSNGKYIKFTENFIDLTKRESYTFEWLSLKKRGIRSVWDYLDSTLQDFITQNENYEIYENVA